MSAALQFDDIRQCVTGEVPEVLAEIYRDHNNLVIWERSLNTQLLQFLEARLAQGEKLNVTEEIITSKIPEQLDEIDQLNAWGSALSDDIARMTEMFAYLFDIERVGLRIRTLDSAMCPRFHIDRVPCRFITTYAGKGTQWLANHAVNRAMLGHASKGLPDDQSGLMKSALDVQTMQAGDIALLKGSAWEGNEHGAIVHRSPLLESGEKRLIMTLDFM